MLPDTIATYKRDNIDPEMLAWAHEIVRGVPKKPAVVIVGHNLSYKMMTFETNPLTEGTATSDHVWEAQISQVIPLTPYGPTITSIKAAFEERWPDVPVYNCFCTCCCAGLERIVLE